MMDFRGYSDDLAYIHDSGFGKFAEVATKRILNILTDRAIPHCTIVELGCGSGITAAILLAHGYKFFGFDLSDGMIKIARERCPQGTFRAASLWQARLPECQVVLSIGECLNYEFDGPNTRGRIRELFHKVYSVLQPRGVFIFDVLCKGCTDSKEHSKNFTEGDDWLVAVERTETADRIKRKIISFRAAGPDYKCVREIHNLWKYDGQEVIQALEATGFQVDVLSGYGEAALPNNHKIFIAFKS